MAAITVLIADAHALSREQLRRFLAQEESIQVVDQARSARQVQSKTQSLQPDILLLDVGMPKGDGLELLAKIRTTSPRTKICILADVFEEGFITGALQHGAQGYLLKMTPQAELVKAIRTTHAGELWAPRKLLTKVLENLRQKVDELEGPLSKMREILTDREQEVVSWAVQSLTNKEIAVQLNISEKTVKTHLQNIFRKLKISRRLQLLCLDRTALSAPRTSPPYR